MDQEMLKINLLADAGFGLLVAILGIVMYFFQEILANYMRFLLPIPPISVAAYIFVINFYREYGGKTPNSITTSVRELLMATGVSAMVFALISLWLIILLDYARRFL